MKQVGIVVVTYNRIELLKEVIDALRKQSFDNFQIVVVNNGSTDSTLEWLEHQGDIITITQENLGGAGGFYTGMKYVAEQGYEYCWIMDDDVICRPDALAELYKAYHVETNVGFVCSQVIGLDGQPMNVPELGCLFLQEGQYPPVLSHVSDSDIVSVKSATFVSVFLSTKTIFEVGLPYKEYFIWGDDSEYTKRIAYKHYCFVACRSVVLHKRRIQGSLSFKTETDPTRMKNYFYMYRNHAHTFMADKKNGSLDKIYYRLKMIREIKDLYRAGYKNQAKIVFKALWALRKFKPQIQFPDS